MTGKNSPQSLDDLAKAVCSGDRVALGRAITLIESTKPEDQARAQELLKTLLPLSLLIYLFAHDKLGWWSPSTARSPA